MSYYVGDALRFSCEFTDMDDTATDPTTVTLLLESPSGTVTTLTHGAGEITRASVGSYYYDRLVDESGLWEWRWVGTGAVQRARQGRFYVKPENVEAV